MSTYAVQGETLGLIADAIRGKLGTDEPMEVSSMASLIEGIPSGGLPPTAKGLACGVITIDAPTNTITIEHNLGILPTFCGITALYDNWEDQPLGSCVKCQYMRNIVLSSPALPRENTYLYEYAYKHPTSGNMLVAMYSIYPSPGQDFTKMFTYDRGSYPWASTDNNGKPIKYLWFCLGLDESPTN